MNHPELEPLYRKLQQKCDAVGIGFPATEEGFELNYLEELFQPEEAQFFVDMPEGYHSAEQFAEHMQLELDYVERMLAMMSLRGLVFRLRDGDKVQYRTVPVIHGFYEFSLDRLNKNIAKNFSRHYVRGLGSRFFAEEDPFFRILPINTDIVSEKTALPLDDALAIIDRQEKIAVTDCFCRTAGKHSPSGGCDYPMETCILFGIFADFYLENGTARVLSKEEAKAIIHRSDALGLVIEVSNSQNVEVMCSCCRCCCGVMNAIKLFPGQALDVASNYICQKDESLCIDCGLCAERCIPLAHKMIDGKEVYDPKLCIGCGLCVTTCPTKALSLHRKEDAKLYTPPGATLLDTYDVVTAKRQKNSAENTQLL